jgi:serine/threonine protein kinase
MTPEQFRRVRDLFESVLEADPPDVAAWLDARAGDDLLIRREVAALLATHSRAGSFLTDGVAGRLPDLLAGPVPGETIGIYVIEKEIGRGGVGHVYLARDTRIGRMVALKALAPHLVRDASQRERLRREAQAAGALTHPGICTVYALEEKDEELFIVYEFVEGRTLREEIAGGTRPSGAELRETARELASALASAHAKGITHRDLKPENVMRTADGRLKILDFGLARIEQAGARAADPVTQQGTLVGTLGYMAPEQLEGRLADARTDVFAFGLLLYEYASGVHPFESSSALGVTARVLEREAVPIAERRRDMPRRLATVIDRCLRKSPEERFASAADLAAELAREDPSDARSVWWRRHQFVAVALYLLAASVGWLSKESQHGVADTLFILISVAATIGGVFRGHLIFTEWTKSTRFTAELRRARGVLVSVDLVEALAVGADGVLLMSVRPLASVVTLALGVGLAIAVLVMEPARTADAFSDRVP